LTFPKSPIPDGSNLPLSYIPLKLFLTKFHQEKKIKKNAGRGNAGLAVGGGELSWWDSKLALAIPAV
jgi:hypothetical protein